MKNLICIHKTDEHINSFNIVINENYKDEMVEQQKLLRAISSKTSLIKILKIYYKNI